MPAGLLFFVCMSFFGVVALVDHLLEFHWSLITAISLWIAGGGVLLFAAGYELLWFYRKRHWKHEEGTVTERVFDGDSCYPKISYSTGDTEKVFVSRYGGEHIEVGRKTCVYYCSDCHAAEEYRKFACLRFVRVVSVGLMLVGMGVISLLS